MQGETFQLLELRAQGEEAVSWCFPLQPHTSLTLSICYMKLGSMDTESKQPQKAISTWTGFHWELQIQTLPGIKSFFSTWPTTYLLTSVSILTSNKLNIHILFVCVLLCMCMCQSVCYGGYLWLCLCSICLVVVHQRRLPVSLWALWSHVWLALTQKE